MAVFDLRSIGRLHRATGFGSIGSLGGIFMEEPLGHTAIWLAMAQRIVE